MNIELLNQQLKSITIRDPIKTLLNPKLEFVVVDDNQCRLSIKIDTFDARSGQRLYAIEANGWVPAYVVERMSRDLKVLGKYVHSCLCDYMKHEISESIMIGDKFVVEPIHWGPDV